MRKLLVLILIGFCIAGCARRGDDTASQSQQPQAYPYQITTTIAMITDIVREVAGEHAQVTGIIGEGIDPHLYQPSRNDRNQLAQADVIFYNGLMLEGKMGDVLVKMARTGKPVHAVTEAILEQGDYVITDAQKHFDPHVWMDVSGWMLAVQVVADALAEYDPDHAADYRANAQAYLEKLEQLDSYVQRVFDSIPPQQRVLITAHDAFSYMGRAYGLEVRGIQGLSTESEAGLRDIEQLIAFLVEREIPAVFVETSVADKNVRALVEGARAQGHEVKIGGELFSDAMGKAGTYRGTYIGMLDHNATTIARALGGDAPPHGMQNKLTSTTQHTQHTQHTQYAQHMQHTRD